MNLQTDAINRLCHELGLARATTEWAGLAQRAADQSLSFAQFLESVLTAERDSRDERKRATFLNFAGLPSVKTLEQYDFAFASGAPRKQINELSALSLSSVLRTWFS